MISNERVMDRVETLSYMESKIGSDRIVVPRYNDGEYFLMNEKWSGLHGSIDFNVLPDLLKKSIKVKGQLLCINYLKPHNIEKKDRWYDTQKYLIDISRNDLYGCANWATHDFQNKNGVLPFLFSGQVLLVTGHPEEGRLAFEKTQPNLNIYPMPKKDASKVYEKVKLELKNLCESNNFDNILFACGPVGKVLLADLVDICGSNLIDLGAVINAIMNEYSQGDKSLVDQWYMSWAQKDINLKECADDFFNKLEELG